jgi:biotin carboxyl carrier protein
MHHRHADRRPQSLVPILAALAGLAIGLTLHQSVGADAAGRLTHDRPPLERRDVGEPAAVSHARVGEQVGAPHVVVPAPAPQPPAQPQSPPALPAPATHSRAFAGLDHLQLVLPVGARAIGFHESGTRGAKALHPMGIPRVNDNMTRLAKAPVGDGFEYLVLGSRERRNAPTSAVDVSMPFNTPVQSPVTGRVVDATAYLLYREVPDNAVYLVPDRRPDLVVVLMHLNGLKVNVGDRVEAGKTVLALTARLLPFGSQIDRYAGRMPHVHMEVRPNRF